MADDPASSVERALVLVVEDDDTDWELLSDALVGKYLLVRATGGGDAIDHLNGGAVQAALVDMKLPGAYTGVDVYQRAKSLNVPVRVMTTMPALAWASGVGEDDILDKSDGWQAMLDWLEKACES